MKCTYIAMQGNQSINNASLPSKRQTVNQIKWEPTRIEEKQTQKVKAVSPYTRFILSLPKALAGSLSPEPNALHRH